MANKKVAPLTDTEIKKLKPNIEDNKDYTKADGNCKYAKNTRKFPKKYANYVGKLNTLTK